MIRAVLFDAAGTLIEPIEAVGETYAAAARDQGLAISAWRLQDAFARVVGQEPLPTTPVTRDPGRAAVERAWWRDVVRRTFLAADSARRAPDPDALFDALWARYSSPDHWRPRPGAPALLESLGARQVRAAVVSNFDSRLPGLLEALGLDAWLEDVVLASDAGVAKPDPGIFRFALARLGLASHEALFVGDDPDRDLAGARAAGLATVDARTLATLDDLQLPEGES